MNQDKYWTTEWDATKKAKRKRTVRKLSYSLVCVYAGGKTYDIIRNAPYPVVFQAKRLHEKQNNRYGAKFTIL